jgi:hypothetical protein
MAVLGRARVRLVDGGSSAAGHVHKGDGGGAFVRSLLAAGVRKDAAGEDCGAAPCRREVGGRRAGGEDARGYTVYVEQCQCSQAGIAVEVL